VGAQLPSVPLATYAKIHMVHAILQVLMENVDQPRLYQHHVLLAHSEIVVRSREIVVVQMRFVCSQICVSRSLEPVLSSYRSSMGK